jgi:hypothetical protein
MRRWWKPAEYDDERPADDNDGHPLSTQERDEEKPVSFADERAKLAGYTAGGEPLDPSDDP